MTDKTAPRRTVTFASLFGGALRRARVNVGLTGTELSRCVGRTQTWLSYIETGRSSPDPAAIVLLAEALDVDPGDLLKEAIRDQRSLEDTGVKVLMCRRPHRQDRRDQLGLSDVTGDAAARATRRGTFAVED